MTTEKIQAVQDDSAPLTKPPPMPVPKGMETLPAPTKTPSIKPPQRTTSEIIARSVVDIVMGILAYLGARGHVISGDVFTFVLIALCGIRVSDIATIRGGNRSGNSDPPIAGGLTGAIVTLFGSLADLFRPHG